MDTLEVTLRQKQLLIVLTKREIASLEKRLAEIRDFDYLATAIFERDVEELRSLLRQLED